MEPNVSPLRKAMGNVDAMSSVLVRSDPYAGPSVYEARGAPTAVVDDIEVEARAKAEEAHVAALARRDAARADALNAVDRARVRGSGGRWTPSQAAIAWIVVDHLLEVQGMALAPLDAAFAEHEHDVEQIKRRALIERAQRATIEGEPKP